MFQHCGYRRRKIMDAHCTTDFVDCSSKIIVKKQDMKKEVNPEIS